jgi:hypothetical protein
VKLHDAKPRQIRDAVQYLHGRIELEIEYYCFNKGIDPLEVTPLVGSALVGTPVDNMPSARLPHAPRQAHPAAPEVEVVDRTHGRRTPAATEHPTREAAPDKVKRRTGQGGYWDSMTATQKSAEMKRRRRKAKRKKAATAAADARWKKSKPKTKNRDLAKQKIYAERSRQRKEGQPLTPLPGSEVKT